MDVDLTHRSDGAALAQEIARLGSVTAALDAWCRARGIGSGPIRAERLPSPRPSEPPPALGLARGEGLCCRAVRLLRGDIALAEAENLYVPERLPPGIADLLERTDTPFGALLAPYGFARVPLDPDAAQDGFGTAALVTLDGRPVAYVRERYSALVLA